MFKRHRPPSIVDPQCNMECSRVKAQSPEPGGPQVLDFEGPIKIVLLNPPDDKESDKRRTAAVLIWFANMMVAANTCTIVLFTLSFRLNLFMTFHVALCTFGFQYLVPMTILIIHPLFGPAMPMSETTRAFEHLKMSVAAGIFIVIGTVLGYHFILSPQALLNKLMGDRLLLNKIHVSLGYTSISCFSTSWSTGVVHALLIRYANSYQQWLVMIHRYSGMLTVVTSNACFILGIVSPSMQLAMYLHAFLTPTIAMAIYTVFFTMVLGLYPGWHYME